MVLDFEANTIICIIELKYKELPCVYFIDFITHSTYKWMQYILHGSILNTHTHILEGG